MRFGATMRQPTVCLERLYVVGARTHGSFDPFRAMRVQTGEWKLIERRLARSARKNATSAAPAGA